MTSRPSVAPGRLPGAASLTVVGLWFSAALAAAHADVFTTWGGLGPLSAVQTAIVLPVAVFWAAWAGLASVRRWVAELDLVFLSAIQCTRILGTGHLLWWGFGLMTGRFAFPVALGNFAVTVLAVITTVRVARRSAEYRRWLWGLTLLGTAEFLMTIGLAVAGMMAIPASFDPPVNPAGLADFRRLPLSVFPTFLIPFFLVVHSATFARLGVPRPGSGQG